MVHRAFPVTKHTIPVRKSDYGTGARNLIGFRGIMMHSSAGHVNGGPATLAPIHPGPKERTAVKL